MHPDSEKDTRYIHENTMYPCRVCGWNEYHTTKELTTKNYVTGRQANTVAIQTTDKENPTKTMSRTVA